MLIAAYINNLLRKINKDPVKSLKYYHGGEVIAIIFKNPHKADRRGKSPSTSGSYRKIGLETNPSNYGWYTCVHCGKKFRKGSIDIDHILPKSKGGGNNPENLQCLCVHCNRSKRDSTGQTSEDLKKRRQSFGQYKREEVLKPKLQEKQQEVNKLKRQLSDTDIKELMDKAKKSKDLEIYHELQKEARRRKIKDT